MVDIGPVQVFRFQHVIHPHLQRYLNDRVRPELTRAVAWRLPNGRTLTDYLQVTESEPPGTMMLQLARGANRVWLQLVDEDEDMMVAYRDADINVEEIPNMEPEEPNLLLVIYRTVVRDREQTRTSDLTVLAVPVSELKREIRVLAPFPLDRPVKVDIEVEGEEKFPLSDILLGAETERFIREVKSEFQCDPNKRYTLRLVRSNCIARYPIGAHVVATYCIPQGSEKAIPVSLRVDGQVEALLNVPVTSVPLVSSGRES